MNQILIPISFSEASANSVRQVNKFYPHARVTLLNCYSPYPYNREFNFGVKAYDAGIREMLLNFYKKHTNNGSKNVRLIAVPGGVSDIIVNHSRQYDLLVMSKSKWTDSGNFWYSDRVTYIASNGHCPVLLLAVSENYFDFKNCNNIWHIKRQENETGILESKLPKFAIDPNNLKIKSLEQPTHNSSLWRSILFKRRSKNKNLLSEISKTKDIGKIDLIVVVSHKRATFQSFMRGEIIRLINEYQIPILIFQE